MDIMIWLVLTIIAVFFTVLMLTVEDYVEIKGFGIVYISWYFPISHYIKKDT